MNKLTLMSYEIKRGILSKKYFYMILLTMGVAYDSLTRLVTGGYYGTAPFSEWTYGLFLHLSIPLAISATIFMMTNIFDEGERRARSILFSAPISQREYFFLKSVAVVVAFFFLALVPIGMSFIYYKVMFNFTDFTGFFKHILWTYLPTFVFFLGLCMVLGRISIKLLYGLIPIAFLLGTMDTSSILPYWLDIFGSHYFHVSSYTYLLGRTKEVIPFSLSMDFIYSRIILIGIGCLLLAVAWEKPLKG